MKFKYYSHEYSSFNHKLVVNQSSGNSKEKHEKEDINKQNF
jgi:hypothetical protein